MIINNKGFTLIELLLAMAIFAVMSLMAYTGLQSVMTTRQQTDADAERLQAIQMAFLHLQRDLNFASLRTIRDEFGTEQYPFLIAETGTYRLELTRDGYRNPAGLPRSSLQRVAYSVDDNTLWRLYWPVLDRAPDSQPRRQKLLDNVEALDIRALDANQEWQTSWPVQAQRVPRAVEISLDLQDWDRLSRLFLMSEPD